MAHDTKYLRRFTKQGRFCASFPSPPQLHFCEPPSLSLYRAWNMTSLFLCGFCLQACRSSALRTPKPANCRARFPGMAPGHVLVQIRGGSVTQEGEMAAEGLAWGTLGIAEIRRSLALGTATASLARSVCYQAAHGFHRCQHGPQIPKPGWWAYSKTTNKPGLFGYCFFCLFLVFLVVFCLCFF